MSDRLSVFVLSVILITGMGISPVFAQNSITVTTDKISYSEGDKIIITGEVSQITGEEISLRITSPNGNLVSIDQFTVNVDKKFSTTLSAGGALMKNEGTYLIIVQYGADQNLTAETSFEFGISINTIPEEVEIMVSEEVEIQDISDLVLYEITGGKVLSINPDMDAKSLIISIEAFDDGSITLTIPRSVLDATINDEDDDFFVLVDAEEVDFDEIASSTDRTLTIEFLAGAEEIEVIGTFVVPEFGTIAAMILAVAIISIIAISAKSRLSIMPRY